VQVELAKYEPNIKCDTSSKPGPPWLSCVTVFSNMRASKQYRVFGSYDQPNVEEGLPLVLEAGKSANLSDTLTVTLNTSCICARGRQMPSRDHHHRSHIHALKLVRDLGRRGRHHEHVHARKSKGRQGPWLGECFHPALFWLGTLFINWSL